VPPHEETSSQKHLGMARIVNVSHSFTCIAMHLSMNGKIDTVCAFAFPAKAGPYQHSIKITVITDREQCSTLLMLILKKTHIKFKPVQFNQLGYTMSASIVPLCHISHCHA